MVVALDSVDLIITGAGGRLGQLLRAAWAECPPTGLRPIWAGRGQGHDIQWDLLSGPAPALPPNAVVLHLAGVTRGDALALQRNAAMVASLTQTCHTAAARRIFFASTAAVYAPGPVPAQESDPVAPPNPYGRSKARAETALLDLAPCPVTLLRIGNVAGADALLGPRIAGEISLDPVPGREGGPVRSWIGARTLALVLHRLALLETPPILNLACDPPLPMADLLTASGLPWRYGPPNPDVVPVAALSVQRLAALCDLPDVTPIDLAAQAAWARGVLA